MPQTTTTKNPDHMASLEDLLAEDGFQSRRSSRSGSRRVRTTATATATTASAAAPPPPPRTVSMPLYHPDSAKNLVFRNANSASHKGRPRGGNAVFARSRSYLSENGGAGDGSQKTSMLRLQSCRFEFSGELLEESEYFEVSVHSDSTKGSFQARPRGPLASSTEDFELYYRGNDMGNNNKIFELKPSFDDHTSSNEAFQPSICEAAIQAVISVLTGYINAFFKDESFRASLHRSCNSCLSIIDVNENNQNYGRVFAELEKAIVIVERVAEEGRGAKELQRASAKLSIITGLSSIGMKDGFNTGIPNSRLAACAHLYLSVICKIQRKGRVAATHLLQVFCGAPFEARTILLPALWDRFFLPHLFHLKAWYEKEVDSIAQKSIRAKNLKLLEKMYNAVLDMGTHKFAVYFNEWLSEETKAPLLPSIHAPFPSYSRIIRHASHAIDRDEVSSPEPMVSQKFYQSVISQFKEVEGANELKVREHDKGEDGEKEIKGNHSDVHVGNSVCTLPEEYEGAKMIFPCSGKKEHRGEQTQESQRTCFGKLDASSNRVELLTAESCKTHKLDGHEAKENESTLLSKVAQAIFELHAVDWHSHEDSVPLKQFANFPACNDSQDNNVPLSEVQSTQSEFKKKGLLSRNSDLNSSVLSIRVKLYNDKDLFLSAEPFNTFEDTGRGSIFSSIPADFLCPLTGKIFKDPVTIETGRTFERKAIKQWLSQGKTCPVTGQQVESLSVPVTNLLLKQLVDVWVSDNCRTIMVSAAKIGENGTKIDNQSKDEIAIDIMDKLLTGYSKEEQMENARNLITLGGLCFLMQRFEIGSLEEKTRVVGILLCCIKAEAGCRKYLADNLKRSCVLELLHSKQVSARTNAVLLLIEMICLNRRRAVTSFLSGLLTETIASTMHALLVHLQSSPPEEKALVAVLLLHFDLMLGECKKSIYKEEAVDGIILALNCCLSDKKVIPNTQRALLMLGGYFSTSGDMLIDSWLLQQGGVFDGSINTTSYHDDDEENLSDEEAEQREKWLKDVSLVLLGNGKRSFLETLNKCLVSGNQHLARTYLVTLAWMSHALVLLSASHQIPLAVFSAFIPQLKEQIKKNDQVEHSILASMSLLNFSKIPGCRFSSS